MIHRSTAIMAAALATVLCGAAAPAAAQVTVTVDRNGAPVTPVRIVAIDANGAQRPGTMNANVGSFDGSTYPSKKGLNLFVDEGSDGTTVLLVPDDQMPPPPAPGRKRSAAGLVFWDQGARFVVDAGTRTSINRNPPVPGQNIGGRFYLPVAARGVIGSNDATDEACGVVNGDFRNTNYTTFSCDSEGRPKGWDVGGGFGWKFSNRLGVEVRVTRRDRGDEAYTARGNRQTPPPSLTFAQDASFRIRSWGADFGVPIQLIDPVTRRPIGMAVTPHAGWRRFTNELRVTNSLDAAGFGRVRSVNETTEIRGNGSEFGVRFSIPSSLVGVELDFSRIKYSGAFTIPNTPRFGEDVKEFTFQIGGVFRLPIP